MSQNLLVSTEWLGVHLNDPSLRVVDIRGHVLPATEPLPHYFNHHHDYVKAHVPGAVFIDWVKEITDPNDPRHAKIALPERFAAVMGRIGVDDSTFVVAYDDADGMFGARLWWSLNYYGHPQVAVLDGGWKKWIAEGHPTVAEVPTIQPTEFIPRPNPNLFRSGDEVLAHLNTGQQLIDVRTTMEFDGKASRAKRAGHIPTARNLPRTALVSPDGTMPSAATLRQTFAKVGVTSESPDVVFYCNGGVSASYGLLALRAAGFKDGSVYDGSWKDWGNDDSKPIES
jgi:thiosulfate/3-mercaptopyruvate sulfurtransferase